MTARAGATGGWARAALVFAWLAFARLVAACASNPYYIGAECSPSVEPCGPGGADAGVHFAVDPDQSGAPPPRDALPLPRGAVRATLRLRGERATATEWSADEPFVLSRGAGAPTPGRAAPFTDGTSAVSLAPDAPTYVASDAQAGSVSADDF